jgi:branched-chain amino acid transport system substrate-binding protein
MKKTLLILAAVFVLALAQTASANKVSDGISVGDAGSFTGGAAAPCLEIFNSAQLAVDEWNAKGGIKGVQIKHVMGDDALDPSQGLKVARKFTSDPTMYGVIGPPVSHVAQATLKVYGQNNLACITTAASKPELTESGYKHFFRVNARNDAHGWNCALFIKNHLKATKVAVLNEKVAYCENMAKQTIKGLEKLGIKDIMNETIVAGSKDFSAVLTKVKAYDPDVLFFVATAAPDQAIGVRQAKELGIRAVFFGTEGARDKKDFIEAAEGAAEGAYVYHFSPDIYAIEEAKGYVAGFEKKYGTLSGFGPPAYEAMNILLSAIEKAAADGEITREEVMANLAATKNYKGILGFPVTFDEKGDLLGGATYFFQVKGKDFKQLMVMTGE